MQLVVTYDLIYLSRAVVASLAWRSNNPHIFYGVHPFRCTARLACIACHRGSARTHENVLSIRTLICLHFCVYETCVDRTFVSRVFIIPTYSLFLHLEQWSRYIKLLDEHVIKSRTVKNFPVWSEVNVCVSVMWSRYTTHFLLHLWTPPTGRVAGGSAEGISLRLRLGPFLSPTTYIYTWR